MVWLLEMKRKHTSTPTTEQLHRDTPAIDTQSVRAAGDLLTAQMQAVDAVQQALSKLGTAAAAMANTIRADRCLHCVGAGSAGLAADADAEELGATCSIPVRQVRIHVAGGLLTGVDMPGDVEDREDGITGNFADLAVGDTVICVSASGSTPYTLAAADLADNRGVTLIAFANNPEAQLLSQTNHAILLPTPPERVAGSTCLGAGKAQKVALNILSTLMGSCLGHIHDGMMINRRADNAKLHDRALRIVGRIARVPAHVAQETLEICKGDVKTAILVAKRGISRDDAQAALAKTDGHLRSALSPAETPQQFISKGDAFNETRTIETSSTRDISRLHGCRCPECDTDH